MVSHWTAEKLIPNDGGRRNAGTRLLVVVPDQDLDVVAFSRSVRSLANPNVSDILLLTIVHSEDSEMDSRRRLATIAALLRDFEYDVEGLVKWSRSWIKSLESLIKSDDTIFCPPEMNIRTGLRSHEPLAEAIKQRLQVNVRPIPGFYTNDHAGVVRFLMSIGYWVVILGIVAGFFVLESDVATGVTNTANQIIMALLVVAEIGVIYLWSMITG
jgi:hypothetical protein